jgi:hypothetical protein
MNFIAWTFTLALGWITTTHHAHAFTTTLPPSRLSVASAARETTPVVSSTTLFLDPISAGAGALIMDDALWNVGLAAVSAAAGVLSQLPHQRALEQALQEAEVALQAARNETDIKVSLLEDKLFALDQEFEAQTARFQRKYDQQRKQELEKFTNQLKADYALKLDVRLQQEKSKMLSSQLDNINGMTGKKQAELVQLKLQQSQMERVQAQLEEALKAAEEEMERMREAGRKRKWWAFF